MIREKLNNHSKVTGSVIGIVVLLSMLFAWTRVHHFNPAIAGAKMYFTTDDSSMDGAVAALFADDGEKYAPFDHDGKPAYRAYVFSVDGGKTKYIAYLERCTPKGLQELDDLASGKIGAQPGGMEQVMLRIADKETEVKKPGDPKWILVSDVANAKKVKQLTPPDGQDATNLKSILP